MILLQKSRIFLFCSLGEAGGVGRVAPQKLTSTIEVVQTVLSYNEADGNGAGLLNPVPRFRRRNGTTKKQACQWFKGGDFPRPLREILPGH